MLLDSNAFAELEEAEFIADAESFKSRQVVVDDCETHRDCLIDSQCKPPSSDRSGTLALHYNPPHSVHTVTLITTFCKERVFFCHVHIHTPSHAFHVNKSCQLYAFDESLKNVYC